MNFFKNWFLNFITVIAVILVSALIGGIFCWLFQFLIGKIILTIIGISLIMTIVENYL